MSDAREPLVQVGAGSQSEGRRFETGHAARGLRSPLLSAQPSGRTAWASVRGSWKRRSPAKSSIYFSVELHALAELGVTSRLMAGDDDAKPRAASCPLEGECPMYELFKLAGMQGLWQALYCHGTYQRCERFQASVAGRPVPPHMLPDGKFLKLNKRPPKA